MKALVLGGDNSWNELIAGNESIAWQQADNFQSFFQPNDATVFFNLSGNAHQENYSKIVKPIFINSVCYTLNEMNVEKNIARINGWSGFLKRNAWEVAGDLSESHIDILKTMQKTMITVPDEQGFISARIISMIINEAFYAKGENVSTEDEIDVAMKLGTNYPYGPFEWSKKIGIKNVHELLTVLNKNDSRYRPSPLLEKQAKEQ